ncbi:exodeoxyribonuclease I [Blochmannia endosymbiont of Camponotus (Colobopsis) obliquus]|uniref:exodeoxyribonuclease I n=1 Tax=Blochmannia endosymbiont of Camponotus (Colobopsis) obliquus TaxID=1505597 RepID=UPI00061A5552|nr:exodeoxyribonuclease I [Blochmannia endosymbiont of Camponotus (Colobopsis) obliquus]AKC60613.1 exodeoxyribonuclease I [Blochmannia endosymbiont of Camponotus (Colobopsis) obliquus]
MKKHIAQPTFLICDYETFGKNPALDKPVQFAAIRTDYYFNPVEKPTILFCRPSDDYLPEPEAVLLNEITPQQALQKGITEAEFTKKIHKILNKPNTCILGYNNIKFDDEIHRNIFYRNFYDPYGWSWKHGNSRWDLLNVMHACYALRPEGIQWPINEQGFPSFKLENLTDNNGITHINSHDAMNDVYATLELAKLIQKIQPKLFNYLYEHRTKQQIKKIINISKMKPLIHVSNILNFNKKNINYIIPIIWHPKNSNILIAYNVNSNIETLLNWNINTLHEQLSLNNTYPKQTEKNNTFNLIHINRCPILVPFNALRTSDIIRLQLNPNTCLKKAAILKNNQQNIYKKISLLYSNTNYTIPSISDHVDNKIYDNFFTTSDLVTMKTVHSTPPRKLSKLKINFIDNRLKSLLFYYKARNFPNTLNQTEHNNWKKYKKKIFNVSKLSIYTCKLQILLCIHRKNKTKINILNSLMEYLKKITNL